MTKKFIVIISLLVFASCNIQKEFYENGEIKAKGKVENNKKNGKWKLYYENGNIFQIGAYSNGNEVWNWKTFHENGKIHQFGKFNDGKQTGEWNFFYSNGDRRGIGTLNNGKRIGIWKWYFNNNGQIQTERSWNNGKLIEIICCYDGQGNKLDKGTLINGNGTMKLYDINGELQETILYKNGEIIK